MSGAITLLPLYAFMARTGQLYLLLFPIEIMPGHLLHLLRQIQSDILFSFKTTDGKVQLLL